MNFVKFIRKHYLAIIIALLLLCSLSVFGLQWLLRHRVETSPFLQWCQTVTADGIAGVPISDPYHREVFTKTYSLSDSEIRELTGILNEIDADDLELRKNFPGWATTFNLYIMLDENNENAYLLSGYAEEEPLLYIAAGSDASTLARFVGPYQVLALNSQAVYDFVKARADGPWPQVRE